MTCKVAEIVPAEIVNKAYEAFSNLFGNKLTKQPGKSKQEQIRALAIEIEQINAKKIQARQKKQEARPSRTTVNTGINRLNKLYFTFILTSKNDIFFVIYFFYSLNLILFNKIS